jgi:branched-chain amino acid aminotransferase
MIWVGGRIVPDDALCISVLDRTFEHGLGLFETLRTWNGHPTLLDRHLARMTRSARELGVPLDPSTLPDAAAVASLLRADRVEGDATLRITLSGGLSESGGSVAWMRSAPLPGPPRDGGAIVNRFWEAAYGDPLARHKTLNYWRRRRADEEARSRGEDETLSRTSDGHIWEGSRTNLFVVFGGMLTTPRADGPLLPGVMRRLVLERAPALGVEVAEGEFVRGTFEPAQEVFLTNSVRGILPVRRAGSRRLPAPGPLTQRLWDDILPWLESGGTTP